MKRIKINTKNRRSKKVFSFKNRFTYLLKRLNIFKLLYFIKIVYYITKLMNNN